MSSSAPTGRLFWGRCPECSSQMRVRSGPRGRFLGCSAYPACSYTERLDAEARMILDGRLE